MTITDIAKSFFGLFKLTPRHLATFAIASLIIYFIPQELSKGIIPDTLHNYYRPFAGLVFILCISGLVVEFVFLISNPIRYYFLIKKGKARLNFLTKEEKNILRRYTNSESRTYNFSHTNGTIAELESLGILFCLIEDSHVMQGFPYGIADWALKYLKRNAHLLILLCYFKS